MTDAEKKAKIAQLKAEIASLEAMTTEEEVAEQEAAAAEAIDKAISETLTRSVKVDEEAMEQPLEGAFYGADATASEEDVAQMEAEAAAEPDWQDQEPTGPDDPRYAEPEPDWQDQEPTGPDDPRYAEPSEEEALALFDVVHGKGSFDPKSSMDAGKLKQIKQNLLREDYQGLSPVQFALKMYRESA